VTEILKLYFRHSLVSEIMCFPAKTLSLEILRKK